MTDNLLHHSSALSKEDPYLDEKRKFRLGLRMRQIYNSTDLLKHLTKSIETPTYLVEDAILYLYYNHSKELKDNQISSIKKLTLQLFLKAACIRAEETKNLLQQLNTYVIANKDSLKNNPENTTVSKPSKIDF